MRELVVEMLLRLLKVILATIIGLAAWAIAVGPAGATPSADLWILCFIGGGIFVLLVQEGPI
jgi:hypothetical protein